MSKLLVDSSNPVLRSVASPVPPEMFGTERLAAIIQKMRVALEAEDDGVAIAAPQIGEPWRIFVVSHRAFEIEREDKKEGKREDAANTTPPNPVEDMVFINPEITKLSKDTRLVAEGCLSLRYLYGKVRRSRKAFIRAQDFEGKFFNRGGSGLIAQIFQHETDHLEGILFIDKAKQLENLPPKQ